MKKTVILLITFFLACHCQEPPVTPGADPERQKTCRIMFWNAENLFDCYDDSLSDDEEFLPGGLRGWNFSRYHRKINNMYKVFIAVGDWDPPDIIGLCEIENKNVLFDLLRDTPFSYYNYRFIHHDSPDRRGIDVALIYNPLKVEIISETPVPVILSNHSGSGTRDILYTRIKIETGDTISVFVNHWPSKYGGAGVTNDLRVNAAKILSRLIVNVLALHPNEKMIVMGDFNDPPESNSMTALCQDNEQYQTNGVPLLINLGKDYKGSISGSYKFEGVWQMIDQVLVNRNFLSTEIGTHLSTGNYRVFAPAFLLEEDEKFGGMKPNRTYTGFDYHGGYSDHLPVILDLFVVP